MKNKIKLLWAFSFVIIFTNIFLFVKNMLKYSVLPGVDIILHSYYVQELINGNYHHDYPLGFHTLVALFSKITGLNIEISLVSIICVFLFGVLILFGKILKNKELLIVLIFMPFLYNNLINGAISHIFSLFFILAILYFYKMHP